MVEESLDKEIEKIDYSDQACQDYFIEKFYESFKNSQQDLQLESIIKNYKMFRSKILNHTCLAVEEYIDTYKGISKEEVVSWLINDVFEKIGLEGYDNIKLNEIRSYLFENKMFEQSLLKKSVKKAEGKTLSDFFGIHENYDHISYNDFFKGEGYFLEDDHEGFKDYIRNRFGRKMKKKKRSKKTYFLKDQDDGNDPDQILFEEKVLNILENEKETFRVVDPKYGADDSFVYQGQLYRYLLERGIDKDTCLQISSGEFQGKNIDWGRLEFDRIGGSKIATNQLDHIVEQYNQQKILKN